MKNKIIKYIPMTISVILLCALVAFTKNTKQNEQKILKPKAVKTAFVQSEEMRGVWVTYIDLDMSGSDYSYKSFKNKFNKIADTAKKDKFNTLIVQVRPFADALYKSAYYPYSHILSGKQGKNPGYDALKYMVKYAHKIGLKIHAWINPYRVKNKGSLQLSNDNPYVKNNKLGVKVNGGIFLNPALEEVRKLIENGVREIIKNYDVDGIQFDDYFYPTSKESFDKKQYKSYVNETGVNNALELSEWRMTNVNILVADCFEICQKYKKVFGISPQGNIENDYNMYADVKSWCANYGYIDYICPQLYYSLDNPALKFADALNEWKSLEYDKSVTLYIGIAGYKTGTNSDSGTWNSSDKILQSEIKLLRSNNIKGFMFYSYANLESEKAAKEVANMIKELN